MLVLNFKLTRFFLRGPKILTGAQLRCEDDGGGYFKTHWINCESCIIYSTWVMFPITWCDKKYVKKLIMNVTNSLSIFESESCLILTIELLESFEYEILMYQNISLTKYLVRLHLFHCCNMATIKRKRL